MAGVDSGVAGVDVRTGGAGAVSSIAPVRRRSVILALAGILVVGIVTPVLGHSRHAGVDRALDRAKKAKRIAKQALPLAQQASAKADQANQTAGQVQADLNSTKIASDTEGGLVTSSSPIGSFEDLGGPSVQVTVPGSGLIEVWAQAEIRDDDGGTVALFEDGQPVNDIAEDGFCGDDSALFEMQGGGAGDFETFSTPPIVNLTLGCTSTGAPAPVLLQRPPGQHTYELRYSECSCGGEAELQNRVLRVGPRL
jgi:hypothetical protein